jgi:hypothetical protein
MRRGYGQPISSSISHSTGPGAREPGQRTRQGRNDVRAQAESSSARREMSAQPCLSISQQPANNSPASPGRKSPAYLEGKNPYGQILDSVDHSYRTPKALGGAPSQAGATSESRPRTSGSFRFKTRPESKAEPKAEFTEPGPLPTPQPRQSPIKPASVKAAKDFFEAKVSQVQSGPVFPPRGAATANTSMTAKKLTVGNQLPPPPFHQPQARIGQPKHVSRSDILLDEQPNLEPEYPVASPPSHLSSDLTQSRVVDPFDLLQANVFPSRAITHEATLRRDSPLFGLPEPMPGSRKPTDDFEANWQDEKPPSYQQQIDSSRPDEAHETVRRGFTYDTVITAESDEGASEATLPFQSQAGRARPDLTVREAIDGDPRSNAKDEEFQVGLSSKPGLLESPRTNNNQA